jgi:serpin B
MSGGVSSIPLGVLDVFNILNQELVIEKILLTVEGGDTNMCLSPYSILVLVGLLLLGAEGGTAKELFTALKLDKFSKKEVEQAFHVWVDKSLTINEVQRLHTATVLLIGSGLRPCMDYLEMVDRVFRAKVVGGADVDEKDYSKILIEVKKWAESSLRNDTISSDFFTSRLSFSTAFTCSIHTGITFKCAWNVPFRLSKTLPLDFTLDGGRKVRVLFMSKTSSRFRYGSHNIESNEGYSVLSMYFSDRWYRMYIILPSKLNGMQFLVNTIKRDNGFFANIEEKVNVLPRNTKVSVLLPRFVVDQQQLDLRAALERMGIKHVFNGEFADFSGAFVNGHTPLVDVKHSAKIEFNEKGVSATAVSSGRVCADGVRHGKTEVIQFVADHPFLYAIQDTRTSGFLFLGKIVNPSLTA